MPVYYLIITPLSKYYNRVELALQSEQRQDSIVELYRLILLFFPLQFDDLYFASSVRTEMRQGCI